MFYQSYFYIFRQLPSTKRLKERINSGYWNRTPEEEYRIEMIKRNLSPDTKDLIERKDKILATSEPFTPIKI